MAADSPIDRIKTPPQSLEAEKAVLGGIMIDNSVMDAVQDTVTPADFYRDAHRRIFDAALALYRKKEPVDPLTLAALLGDTGSLDAAGGLDYINSLLDEIPSAANIEHYARIVHEKSILRNLISVGGSLATAAMNFDSSRDLAELLNDAEQMVFGVSQEMTGVPFVRIADIVEQVYDDISRKFTGEKEEKGIRTGFTRLDSITYGMHPGNMIVVAGRPGTGKTALALNIAEHVALKEKLPVFIASLEMSCTEVSERMLCSLSGLESGKFKSPRKNLTQDDFGPLSSAMDKLSKSRIFIDDSGGLNVMNLRAGARRVKHECKGELGLIIVDYLQLMSGERRDSSREQEVSYISRNIKAMAKELNVPILALSQLNRGPDKRESKRPNLSDLRESGAIEQDADIVMFIYRDTDYASESADRMKAQLILAKNRHGPTDTIDLKFVGELTKFYNVEGAGPEEPGF